MKQEGEATTSWSSEDAAITNLSEDKWHIVVRIIM